MIMMRMIMALMKNFDDDVKVETMEEADYGICGVMGKTRSRGRCRNARGNERGNLKNALTQL